MIGVPGKDGRRTVELLREHCAGKAVGQSHWPEREKQVRLGPHSLAMPVGTTDQKGRMPAAVVAAGTEPGGKGSATQELAAFIERDDEIGVACKLQ